MAMEKKMILNLALFIINVSKTLFLVIKEFQIIPQI